MVLEVAGSGQPPGLGFLGSVDLFGSAAMLTRHASVFLLRTSGMAAQSLRCSKVLMLATACQLQSSKRDGTKVRPPISRLLGACLPPASAAS